MGTANQQIRLAPVYDVVSTTYYPELSKDMAMKIGREYSSDKVTLKDFEQLAEEAGLAKPIVRNRVPELAETVIANLDKAGIEHPAAEAVAALIRKHCEIVRTRFRN
jgi:serine/threonine-protein kinase HipA